MYPHKEQIFKKKKYIYIDRSIAGRFQIKSNFLYRVADGPIKFDYGQTGAGKLESTIDATAGIIVMINNDNYNNKKTDLCCKQRQKRDRQTNIQTEREREKKNREKV